MDKKQPRNLLRSCFLRFNGPTGGTLKPWPELVEGLFGGGLASSINFFVSF